MPLVVNEMPRQFVAKIKGKEIELPDPNREYTEEMVLNHYALLYPELISAKVGAYEIKNDIMQYRFDTVMGTKG